MAKTIIDALGRAIGTRPVGVKEQLRLYKALGPDLSQNDAYMGLAMAAVAAESIDGMPLPFPDGEAGLEFLLDRLGDEGILAIIAEAEGKTLTEMVAEAGN